MTLGQSLSLGLGADHRHKGSVDRETAHATNGRKLKARAEQRLASGTLLSAGLRQPEEDGESSEPSPVFQGQVSAMTYQRLHDLHLRFHAQLKDAEVQVHLKRGQRILCGNLSIGVDAKATQGIDSVWQLLLDSSMDGLHAADVAG